MTTDNKEMPVPPLASTPHDACPTEDQLVLAHDHERHEMERYRGLALGFLPTRLEVSRLMASLGIKCEIRLASLSLVARHLDLQHCLPAPVTRRLRPASAFDRQAFIADETMTCQTMRHALAAGQQSCQFTELLARLDHPHEFSILMGHFIEQKQHECRLLEAAQQLACVGVPRE